MIKKNIKLFYTNSADYQQLYPLYLIAKDRGYTVSFTDDIFEKCEIGVYCQHVCFPENSKFSVIMLHDIGQAHGYWPNIWYKEPWNKYDIGILPNREWREMWKINSCFPEANPRIGVFEIGWCKADLLLSNEYQVEIKKIIETYEIDLSKKTVLYAPSWENDGKESDFVDSCRNMNINILIKQFDYDKDSESVYLKNVESEREKHASLSNVYHLDPKLNIFIAIGLCDIMVSDESSTMFEAAIMGKPAIAVEDWLIPDTSPSRFSEIPFDFVIKTRKGNLNKTICEVINNLQKYEEKIKNYKQENFNYIGNVAEKILDIIDSSITNIDLPISPIAPLPKTKTVEFVAREIERQHKKARFVQKFTYKNKIGKSLYMIYRKIKIKIV